MGDPCAVGWQAFNTLGVILYDLGTFGITELVATPMTMAHIEEREKARGEWHLGVLYDDGGSVLSLYDAAPGERADVVLAPLTQEVRFAVITGGWPTWRDTLGRQARESHHRAACTGYALTPEEAQRVTRVERIAKDVDAGRLAREAGRDALSACYLGFEGVCPIADDEGSPAPTAAGRR